MRKVFFGLIAVLPLLVSHVGSADTAFHGFEVRYVNMGNSNNTFTDVFDNNDYYYHREENVGSGTEGHYYGFLSWATCTYSGNDYFMIDAMTTKIIKQGSNYYTYLGRTYFPLFQFADGNSLVGRSYGSSYGTSAGNRIYYGTKFYSEPESYYHSSLGFDARVNVEPHAKAFMMDPLLICLE